MRAKKVSVVVPARNESGNLARVIGHIKELSDVAEILIVEGGSIDNTWDVACSLRGQEPELISVMRQSGKGKFNAVIEGAFASTADFILIWDGDGTVSKLDTERIVKAAIQSDCGAFGDRLKGYREPGSMRFANLIGNWFFALIWAPLLKIPAGDMLCGTKIFPRRVFLSLNESLVRNDPFGDFALMLNCTRLGIRLIGIPVNYDARNYGETNINRWRDGLKLLRFSIRTWLRLI